MKPPQSRKAKIVRRGAAALGVILIAGAAAFGVTRLRSANGASTLPTAQARKGEFTAIIRCRGELKARQSVQVTAPRNVPELRIVWLAAEGAVVKQGDAVIRFDPSAAKQQLQEKEAGLKQAQAALDQAVANNHVTAEQDKIEVATAEYEVEKARLEVSKAEIVSRLQGEQSRVDLSVAEKKLEVKKASAALNKASGDAKAASLARLRDKAKDELELTQYRLDQMEVKAPGNGMFHILSNFSQGWVNAKPFKVGDQAWPGGVIAEIPDLETLEMEGKIEEIDRGRMTTEQDVRVRIDSLPESTWPAKLAQLSPMTVMAWEWPPSRTFRGYGRIVKADSRLRPGMNGSMDVIIDRIADAIIVPTKAVHTRAGKPIVYLVKDNQPQAVEVKMLARNPDEVAITGVAEGAAVALAEPEEKGKS